MAEALKTYTDANFVKFIRRAKKVGYKPYHYKGRFFFEGPAIDVDRYKLVDIEDVFKGIKVQWDNLGLDFVVYPRRTNSIVSRKPPSSEEE